MTRPLSFALIGDGTSDQALTWIITWAIRKLQPDATSASLHAVARAWSRPFRELQVRCSRTYSSFTATQSVYRLLNVGQRSRRKPAS